ncbi:MULTISPECIES: YiiX family permuted papain-like enzyme [unclassified Flavobacterium]|uniref:YiiX family permuted papain-like enzyme n=1 Tax=unclassified Flavobacterium TaxID=196869 RepID=UPI000EAD9F17|nr:MULTISPECIES: YiiX family permuted papain-like enzyme [unclassified Flavobacterium]RKS02266.1 permuted papain-like amidase YaeF/Yiix C92 family enzyme [Flavobacterium sp. 102]
MKKAIVIIAGLLIAFFVLAKVNATQVEKTLVKLDQNIQESLRDGDIIFQTSQSKQCEAVRIATNSKFSHCGIIYDIKGEKYVYEAVQPVKITPLKEWISHGQGNAYLVKRLKNASAILNTSVLEKMKAYGSQFKNKNYDLYFEWTDDKIYCSELVWKIYKNGAGVELCGLESLKSFNLDNPKVKAILQERYGNEIPLEEKVVAPSQLVDSPLLETVIDTY